MYKFFILKEREWNMIPKLGFPKAYESDAKNYIIYRLALEFYTREGIRYVQQRNLESNFPKNCVLSIKLIVAKL